MSKHYIDKFQNNILFIEKTTSAIYQENHKKFTYTISDDLQLLRIWSAIASRQS